MGKTPCFNKVHHLVKVASRCYYYHIIYFVLSVDICHHSTYCICHLKKKKNVAARILQGQVKVFDSPVSPYHHPKRSLKEDPACFRDRSILWQFWKSEVQN